MASYISHVTLWEIAIKLTIGELTLQLPFPDLEKKLKEDGFQFLPITTTHITAYSKLPLHHRDPFDRLLIAQSITEGFPILGQDEAFDAYTVQRVW
ncbi:MAG: type II toxin-antitoxin system VapC family toxin [Bacteroidetes bacterium]|nr:type II toxin-antitoxin system VapC family toxin [Bacteroidota bacterium]